MKLRNSHIPYTYDDLYGRGKPRVYRGEARHALCFPLGGLGTGSLHLLGSGEFRLTAEAGATGDECIWLALRAQPAAGSAVAKLLTAGPAAEFTPRFPGARLLLGDAELPLAVTLVATGCLAPLQERDAALPAALCQLVLRNDGPAEVAVQVALGLGSRVAGDAVASLPSVAKTALLGLGAAGAAPRLVAGAVAGRAKLPAGLPMPAGLAVQGTLPLTAKVAPGATVALDFWLCWAPPQLSPWDSAIAAAAEVAREHARLAQEVQRFADALHAATLPALVLEAVTTQLALLQRPAVAAASPHPEQALAYLFPGLARAHAATPPAAEAPLDALLGQVLSLYREWLLGAGDAWLREQWPLLRQLFVAIWARYDGDRDGLLEQPQRHSGGLAFSGPNTVLGTWYLAALRAAAELAEQLGEEADAATFQQLFEQGRALLDALLFNGEYFLQDVALAGWGDAVAGRRHRGRQRPDHLEGTPSASYGQTCLAEQLGGAWSARLLRLGDLLEDGHVHTALASIFAHNWRAETGLAGAALPGGKRLDEALAHLGTAQPALAYQLASHLLAEGWVEEGLAVLKSEHDRAAGASPWPLTDAARPGLAAFTLLLSVADCHYGAAAHALSFSPVLYRNDFAGCFFTATGWGMLRQQQKEDSRRIQLSLLAGELTLEHLQIGLRGDDLAITVGQQSWPWESYPTSVGTLINLGRPLTLKPGDILTIQVLGEDDEDALPEAAAPADAAEADAADLIAAEDEP